MHSEKRLSKAHRMESIELGYSRELVLPRRLKISGAGVELTKRDEMKSHSVAMDQKAQARKAGKWVPLKKKKQHNGKMLKDFSL